MSTQELLAAINLLPTEDRLVLLESLARSLRAELRSRENIGVPVSEIRGIAKPDGEPPSDNEIREGYIQHLMEKYA